MKTFEEFLQESALARLALKGISRAVSKSSRVARTADGGRRITSVARASRNVKPRALSPKGPPADRHGSLRDYRDTNSDLAAFKRAGFRANKNDVRSLHNYNPNNDISPKYSDFKEPGSLYTTMISKHKNQATYAQRQMQSKVGYNDNHQKVARPTASRAVFLKQLKKQMGGTRTSKPVADIEIATGDYYGKNDPEDLISRGKEFVQTLKTVPDKLWNAGVKPGSKVTGHPAAVMPGELDKVKGRQKRARLYKRIAGSRMSSMNPVTQKLVGTMQ